MPRDSSGNYTLPIGNPVIDGTTIDTNWANPTMSDIAVQLNNVVTRDGLLGFTSPAFFVDGMPALPGIAFAAQHGTGLWRDSTQIGISFQGAAKQVWGATGSAILGQLQVNGNLSVSGTGPYVLKTGDTMSGQLNIASISGLPDLALNSTGSMLLRIASITKALLGGNGYFGVRTSTNTAPSRLTIAADTAVDAAPTNISDVNDSSLRIHAGNGGLPGSWGGVTFVSGTGDGTSGGAAILFRRAGTFGTDLHFYTSNPATVAGNIQERMNIDQSGNVSMGLDAGTSRLNQGNTLRTGESAVVIAGSSTTLVLGQSSGSNFGLPSPTSVAIQIAGAPFALGTQAAQPLILGTNNVERVRIAVDGTVQIGSSATFGPLTSSQLLLTVNAAGAAPINMRNLNGVVPYWQVGPRPNSFAVLNNADQGVALASGASAWAASSDERLKEGLNPIEDAVTKVATLRAVTGQFISDRQTAYAKRRVFLVAQDVQAVLPEAVYEQEDGILSLAYTEVIPLLVAAIKELNVRLSAGSL